MTSETDTLHGHASQNQNIAFEYGEGNRWTYSYVSRVGGCISEHSCESGESEGGDAVIQTNRGVDCLEIGLDQVRCPVVCFCRLQQLMQGYN